MLFFLILSHVINARQNHHNTLFFSYNTAPIWVDVIWSLRKASKLTCRHDAMHGHWKKEDGIAVISPRACTEVLLHGLHNREQFLCQTINIMKHHLKHTIRILSTHYMYMAREQSILSPFILQAKVIG